MAITRRRSSRLMKRENIGDKNERRTELESISDISSDEESSDEESDTELESLAQHAFDTIKASASTRVSASASASTSNSSDVGFVIDTTPGTSAHEMTLDLTHEGNHASSSDEDDPARERNSGSSGSESESDGTPGEVERLAESQMTSPQKKKKLKKQKSRKEKFRLKELELASALQCKASVEDGYLNVDSYHAPESHNDKIDKMLLKSGKQDEIMKKSVITSDFEKRHNIPSFQESLHQLKKQRRAERDKSKGKNWFNMAATEMTEEKKNDLMVLHMRRALNPKRFYKGNDIHALPKFFQMGTVMESPVDFYRDRVPKKSRKKNFVDELLDDAEFRRFNKRKYAEIQEATRKARGPYKHMKRLKKGKK